MMMIAHIRVEVEDAMRRAADPLGEVLRVGERGGQRDDAALRVHLARDVPHARDHHLEDRAHLRGNHDHDDNHGRAV